MPAVIDPSFSVYRLVERIQAQSTLLHHRQTMSLVSFEIENATLLDGARSRIFAGFQRYSKFLPQEARYRRLAERAESVYVFGIRDIIPPAIPNIHYIDVKPGEQLSHEWFLVCSGPDYASALATEELTDIADTDTVRVFKGLWTFERDLVTILHDWLTSTVDAKPYLYTISQENQARQMRLMSSSMNRLMERIAALRQPKPDETQTHPVIRGELQTVVKHRLHPALTEIAARLDSNAPKSPYVSQHEAVILFTDLRNYTALSEQMEPRRLIEQILNPYLAIVCRAVYKHGGTVDKFMGDGVLAVFGVDGAAPDDADRARMAAEEIAREFAALAPTTTVIPQVSIGIAAGNVAMGSIGTSHRQEHTVIGDAVNVAQRLSGLGSNEIWISHTAVDRLSQKDGLEAKGAVPLKGKEQTHEVYRVVI